MVQNWNSLSCTDIVLSIDSDEQSGQASLRRAVVEYLAHYHAERNHQGLGNRLIRSIPSVAANDGMVRRRQRLGGMLNFYYREAV